MDKNQNNYISPEMEILNIEVEGSMLNIESTYKENELDWND